MPETQPIPVASCAPIAQDRQAFEDAALRFRVGQHRRSNTSPGRYRKSQRLEPVETRASEVSALQTGALAIGEIALPLPVRAGPTGGKKPSDQSSANGFLRCGWMRNGARPCSLSAAGPK